MLFLNGMPPDPPQIYPIEDLWYFLPFGYILTVLIEIPILLFGLSSKLSTTEKVLSGVWLTACTYPIVVIVLPTLFYGEARWQYLAVAETFAPVAECLLFMLAFHSRGIKWIPSLVAIVMANLASFGAGEVLNYFGWLGLF
jgi:hypothetical protein